jgi:hypothetical protein
LKLGKEPAYAVVDRPSRIRWPWLMTCFDVIVFWKIWRLLRQINEYKAVWLVASGT